MQINYSECKKTLAQNGHILIQLDLPIIVEEAVEAENYELLDREISALTKENGLIFNTLKEFCPVNSIEHIISLRESKNDWEEDGIWHDDGSRILAFSLSLTKNTPEGGILEFRKKGESESQKIPTPTYGTIIIFKTGIDNYEHKINAVTRGKRLIIAGWCYPE